MRVSATTLESFRLWSEPDNDWMTEDDLLATIRGEFVLTPAILLGRAFGQVLERPDRYRVPHGFKCDDFTFSDETMAKPLALMDHRYGVFEAKASRDYDGVCVVSKADQLSGAQLFEHKTTSSTFDFEKYAKSYQWRFMVDAFEPLSVTYHVFTLDDHGNSVVEVKAIDSFSLFPYEGLHRDCRDLVERFRQYVELRGLGDLLRARQAHAGLEVPA